MRFFFDKFRKNLGLQVFAAFSTLIFCICFSFVAMFVHRQHTILLADWERNGVLLAKTLAYQCRIGVFSENREILRTPAEGMFQHAAIMEITVYNAGGHVIADWVRAANGMAARETGLFLEPEAGPSPLMESGGAPAGAAFQELRVRQHPQHMVVWAPVMSRGALPAATLPYAETGLHMAHEQDLLLGHVRLFVDKAAFNGRLHRALLEAVFLGGLFLVLAALVTYLLAVRISRPLRQLAEGIRKFGSTGEREALPLDTPNEIGNLARAFGQMAEDLERREAEKLELEQQLRQTQKMEAIGTLAGGIAHDFNNILGIISGYSELAIIDVPPDSRAKKCLKEIFTAGRRARDLVQQILTFSRQGGGERKPLQIGFAVKEVMKMLRATLPTTIDVQYHIPSKMPAVLADPTQIHQVVMNLCTNASHAMRETGGVLAVTLENVLVDEGTAAGVADLIPGRYQRLDIRDTGHGMTAEVLERIFDPFFSTKAPGEGTGLGLSVVHGIVKKHGGAIAVHSEPGVGTTFSLYFPSLDESASDEVEVVEHLPMGSERILLVDDEAAMAEMAQHMLESLGYKVSSRTSSVEALAAFKAHPEQYDLVMTDMTMPRMTGAELAREILAIRPDVPIVLCTGFSESIGEATAHAIGVRAFVMKPVVRKDIAEIIRRVLA